MGCSSPHRLENWGAFVIPGAVWRVRKTSSPQRGSHTHRSFQKLCLGMGLQPRGLGAPLTSSDQRGDVDYHPGSFLSLRSEFPYFIPLPLFCTARSPPPLPSFLLSFRPFLLPSHRPGPQRWGPTPRHSGICAGPLVGAKRQFRKCALRWAVLAALLLAASAPRASQH